MLPIPAAAWGGAAWIAEPGRGDAGRRDAEQDCRDQRAAVQAASGMLAALTGARCPELVVCCYHRDASGAEDGDHLQVVAAGLTAALRPTPHYSL